MIKPKMIDYISIHAPLARCDSGQPLVIYDSRISIHAPLARCDGENFYGYIYFNNFNPRTSCEVRLQEPIAHPHGLTISIHAPLARCDLKLKRKAQEVFISIHAPLARCDALPVGTASGHAYFNPRTSCEVRPKRNVDI